MATVPRTAQFKEDTVQAFYDGIKRKPDTTFGNVSRRDRGKEPYFHPGDFCSVIRQ